MATIVAVAAGHPARRAGGAQAGHVDRLRGAPLLHRRAGHAVLLARHRHDPGHAPSCSSGCRPWCYTPFWVNPWQNLAQLIWPALAVGYRYSAVATRMTRSAMLEVLREDYIRTARAKGLMQKLILSRHALKNAMLPGDDGRSRIEFAFLIGGLVVTEQVFNLNGLGLLFVQARGPPRLHAHPGPRDAGLRILHRRELLHGRGVRAGRSAHPVPLTWRSASPLIDASALPEVAAARVAVLTQAGEFCRTAAARRHRGRDHPRHAGACGALAPLLAPYDPVANSIRARCCRAPIDAALARHRRLRPRRPLAPDLRLTHRAAGGVRRAPCWAPRWAPSSGVASAYFGGRIDLYTQRVMDIFLSFPLIILALALVAILGNSLPNLITAITIPMIPRCALVIRASALAIREMPYVDAARAAGLRRTRGSSCATCCPTSWRALPHHADGVPRAGDPGRVLAVVPGPGRAGADGGLGADAARGGGGVRRRRRPGWRSFPGWPSASRCSPSTCSATRCATRSTRACGTSEFQARGLTPSRGTRYKCARSRPARQCAHRRVHIGRP